MKVIFILVIVGFALYSFLKIVLYLYRPFLLNKLLREIQTKYDNLMSIYDHEVKVATEDYNKYKTGDDIRLRKLAGESEDQHESRVQNALQNKNKLQKSNEAFIRLRERFLTNYKLLSETVIAYQRYLELRLQQHKNANLYTQALSSGGITFDEFIASANSDKILIEESERKLYRLLED